MSKITQLLDNQLPLSLLNEAFFDSWIKQLTFWGFFVQNGLVALLLIALSNNFMDVNKLQ